MKKFTKITAGIMVFLMIACLALPTYAWNDDPNNLPSQLESYNPNETPP